MPEGMMYNNVIKYGLLVAILILLITGTTTKTPTDNSDFSPALVQHKAPPEQKAVSQIALSTRPIRQAEQKPPLRSPKPTQVVDKVDHTKPDQNSLKKPQKSSASKIQKGNTSPLRQDKIAKPIVIGTHDFTDRVTAALGLLKDKAPTYFSKVQQYLTKVEESANSGVEVQSGIFYLGRGTASTSDIYWIAGVIVHDATHAEAYQLGRSYSGREGEEDAIKQQKQALLLIGAPSSYQDYLNDVINSDYWDIPFEQRNW
ncbi:MAG: hypothetical protein ACYCX4_08510 [Bacillota bacterium]